jgi:putative transposase
MALDLSSYSDEKKERARKYGAYVDALWGGENEKLSTLERDQKRVKIALDRGETAPSLRTLQRQKAKLIASGGMLRALISRDKAKGNRNAKVDKRLEAYIDRAIENFKAKGNKASFSQSHEYHQNLVHFDNRVLPESKKLKPLSLPAFIKRLEDACPEHVVKTRLLNKNKDVRLSQKKPVRDVKLILQRAEIDHTQLDLFVVDSENGFPLGRPWISALLDYKSKSVLGFYIGFEPPSYLSAAHALYHAISSKSYIKKFYPDVENDWLCCGKPAVLVCDRGKEFESFSLEDACDDLNISIQLNPGKHPWYKGSVERYFQSLNQQLLKDQPGVVLGASLSKIIDYDPTKNAVISLDSLLSIFHIWVIDIYQCNKVSGGKIIPNLTWKEDLDKVSVRPVDPDRLKLVLSESFEAKVTKDGIKKDYIYYDNHELTNFRMRWGFKKVKFKRDRQDLGSIHVYNEHTGRYFKVEAVDKDIVSGVSLYQHKIHKKFVNEILNAELNPENLAIARMKIRDIVNDEFLKNKRNKMLTKRRAARFAGVEMKKDGTSVSSVLTITNQNPSGIPKPSNYAEKRSELDSENTVLPPKSDFDGENLFPDELEF